MDKYFWQMSINLPSTSSTPPSCSELQTHLGGQGASSCSRIASARLKSGSASLLLPWGGKRTKWMWLKSRVEVLRDQMIEVVVLALMMTLSKSIKAASQLINHVDSLPQRETHLNGCLGKVCQGLPRSPSSVLNNGRNYFTFLSFVQLQPHPHRKYRMASRKDLDQFQITCDSRKPARLFKVPATCECRGPNMYSRMISRARCL